MKRIELTKSGLELDGTPFRIFSGAMHYFRIHPALWQDRFEKMKAMGLNTVGTYIAWDIHEPHPGSYVFRGFGNIERYLELAQKNGLKAIVRPGPYICSEWDFGALPGWLTTIPGIRFRCFNQPCLDAVRRWFDELLPHLNRFSALKGGTAPC